MKTNENENQKSRRARREAFTFEPVDPKIIDEVTAEEDARLNGGEGEDSQSGFYTTNSISRMDTQTVHKLMNTTSSIPIPVIGRSVTVSNFVALVLPIVFIVIYIAALVAVDMAGLLGYHFSLSARMIVLYTLYIVFSFIGVIFLMFIESMPRLLALCVIFISLFCTHGNMYIMIPLVISFIAIALTVKGTFARISAYSLAVIMLLCAFTMGNTAGKTVCLERVERDDGQYALCLYTRDDGKSLSYTLALEGGGDIYRRYTVTTGYVDGFYFAGEHIVYTRSDEYGMKTSEQTVEIEKIIS